MKPRWPIRARLYWSRERNVPLLEPHCSNCSDDGIFEVPVEEPGDVRPALRADYERLRDAIVFETGSDRIYRELFAGKVVVLNRVPFMDEMKEVIVDGGHAGKLYFDPVLLRWRFRFSWWTARLAIDYGLVEVIKLRAGEKLGPRLSLGGRVLEEGQQVVIVNSRGDPVAIGYYRGGAVRVQTKLSRGREPLENARKSSIEDAIKANEYTLHKMSARAITFLSVMAEKLSGKPVLVSFSGGKDSLVALDLTVRASLDPEMIFNDTGLELPETIETVKKTAKYYGLKLHIASAGDNFWRAVGFFGPPGRDYRWCCKVTKMAPLSHLARKWPDGALNVVGLRAYESFDRARNPRVWRNRWLPQFLSVTPIREWTQLAVWLYIFKHRLPYNPLYDMGYERIGCFMCPAGFLAEYILVSEKHPQLWQRWERVLEEWRQKLGLPREWITHALWRWHGPAAQKARLAHRLGVSLPNWKNMLNTWVKSKPPSLMVVEDEED